MPNNLFLEISFFFTCLLPFHYVIFGCLYMCHYNTLPMYLTSVFEERLGEMGLGAGIGVEVEIGAMSIYVGL